MRLPLIAATIMLASSTSAFAWGREGHQIVATIAEHHLSDEARTGTQALLANEGQKTLSDVAVWADAMKALAIPEQPEHSVFLEGDNSPYDPTTMCPQKRCVIGALFASIETLRATNAPIDARTAALNYIVHLVGDMHQPMHVTRLGRGVHVSVNGKETSLHHVWDTIILENEGSDLESTATRIESSAPEYKPTDFLDPIKWAVEGRDIMRDDIMPKVPSSINGSPIVLTPQYMVDNLPIAEERLNFGGRRLADLLNFIFANPTKTVEPDINFD